MKKKKTTVKGFAVIVGGKYPVYAGMFKEAAEAAEFTFMLKSKLDTQIVPCTLTYSL